MDWHLTQNDEYLSLMEKRLQEPTLIWVNQFVEIINNYIEIKENIKINDIGCNVGHFYRGIKDYNMNYIGYDFSKTYIDIAIKNFGKKFTLLDITKKRPRTCDVSIISATVEHIIDYKSALKNIFQSSKKLVILRTFIGNSMCNDYCLKQNAKSSYLIREFTLQEITNIPTEIGWKYIIIDDKATNSISKKVCDTSDIFRTQKVIIFKHE
jgi:SAM-dependent methyltransferase